MKTLAALLLFVVAMHAPIDMQLTRTFSLDSLGACQGISWQKGDLYLYGDRETGVIRQYRLEKDSLVYFGKECKLTVNGADVINHPTGIAINGRNPVFIGNSIRLNPEGTAWKAVIYCVNWQGLLTTGTLDGNLLKVIDDDACVQGTRPEYVQYKKKWYVATADYGNKNNEVRLYDPLLLQHANKTSEKGVLVKKFTCSPWVQNLLWIPEKEVLVLIRNQIEGKRWRFTFLDFNKSVETGKEQVLRVIDIDKSDELEGFTLLGDQLKGIAVTSSQKNNASIINISW